MSDLSVNLDDPRITPEQRYGAALAATRWVLKRYLREGETVLDLEPGLRAMAAEDLRELLGPLLEPVGPARVKGGGHG